MSASRSVETPVYFPCGKDELFGVLTAPSVAPNGAGAVVLMEGGRTPALGRNQMAVRIAACLARHGFYALRLDYRGVGDSGGLTHPFRLNKPRVAEAHAALRWLKDTGLANDCVIVSACFGARTALACVENLPNLLALALISPPVRDLRSSDGRVAPSPRDYLRKARDPSALRALRNSGDRPPVFHVLRTTLRMALKLPTRRSRAEAKSQDRWVAPTFLHPLNKLVDRRVPVLILYGEGDYTYHDFQKGLGGGLGRLLSRAGDLISLVVTPGEVHGFASLASQDAVLAGLDAWLDRLRAVTRGGVLDNGATEQDPARDGVKAGLAGVDGDVASHSYDARGRVRMTAQRSPKRHPGARETPATALRRVVGGSG